MLIFLECSKGSLAYGSVKGPQHLDGSPPLLDPSSLLGANFLYYRLHRLTVKNQKNQKTTDLFNGREFTYVPILSPT